ncbi:hypothetical protein D4A47_02365 [Anaerotruncus massiliensis (ex Liu et al. 2021)]|uniref:Right-handed parallel beta-helix repeat-containing protein n=2 Tax=Anaerotruncus TaxID=244127 RepID=A0A498CQP3_9FIRM|nr:MULTISPECIES: hypothetical protein [Anaerotruncus]MBC3937744.1 hypothetical protein [Anaerotruncus massiliensis (ex Togo et al. 2019)]RLL14847.1 hypothetical protein D4A47_02365 [Anaerotruncus massiliensis (ex Liu et al. 2021)]
MKKNWIRLLTMLLAAMLILTMSGVVSLANDDQPVTGDGVSDVSDTISPVKTEEEPPADESSSGASSEDESSKGASSEDSSSKGASSEDESSKGSSSEDSSSKDANSKDANSKDISSEECTCGAAEGEVHKEGCPLYTEPEEKPSEAVQAVIDMIEALPDTDTVANYEPAVDLPEDDEGYNNAYNEAYSAYLEEAKENYAAAQEAYNALTDEEKAEIPEELTGKLADFAGFIAMLGQVNTLDLADALTYNGSCDAVDIYMAATEEGLESANPIETETEPSQGHPIMNSRTFVFPDGLLGDNEYLYIKVVKKEGDFHTIEKVDIGWQTNGFTYEINGIALGNTVKIPVEYVKGNYGDYDYFHFDVYFAEQTVDGQKVQAHSVFYKSHPNVSGGITTDTFDVKSVIGTYTANTGNEQLELVVEEGEDGVCATLSGEVNLQGGPVINKVTVEPIEFGSDGTILERTVKMSYSVNYYFHFDAEARTLTLKEDVKYRKDAIKTSQYTDFSGSIAAGTVFTLTRAPEVARIGDTTYSSLEEAVTALNETAGSDPVTLQFAAGAFSPTANEQLRITRANVVLKGAAQGKTTIDASAYSVSGQAGLLVQADNVTVEDLTIQSSAGAGVSALKFTAIGDGQTLTQLQGGAVKNVTISSGGHALNLHGTANISVDGLTVTKAGKCAIAVASTTGLTISNTTTCTEGWASIGIMYADGAAYEVPSVITIGSGNNFQNKLIYSERPSAATGGVDKLSGLTGWMKTTSENGAWALTPGVAVAKIGTSEYASLAAAITAAKNGDTITLLADVKEDPVTVDKAVTIDGNGKEFTGTMVVSAGGVTIKNTVFTGTGIVPKDGRNGANHLIKVTCDGTFTFTGNIIRGVDAKTADGQDGIYYDYINIAASGVVTITGNTFDANGGKVYNGIECSQSIPLASGSKIANNTFAKGDCTHNSINIYKVADGGSYDVSGNTFAYSGNAFRLSNYPNADGASPRATFNINNTTYHSTDETDLGYAGLICLQDPTNQNGKFEDFTKFTIHLANLKGPGGEILTKNELGTAKQVFYVYRDGTGIIEDAAQWPVVPEFINTDEEIAGVVAAAIKAGNDALKAALGDDSTTTLATVTESEINKILADQNKKDAFKKAIGEASAMLDKLDAGKLAAYLAKNPDLKKQVDALRMSYDIAFTVAPAASAPEVKATVPADATDAEKQAFEEAKGELAATGNPAAKEPPKNLAEAVKGNLPAEATEAALANNTTEIHVSLETEIHDIVVQEVTNDGITTAVVTEIKFEVQPVWLIKAGNDVKAKGAIDSLSGQPVTFKLPIPKSVTDRYAKIVHEYSGGSETFYLEIQKDKEGNQYVDVTVTHFSPFVVTFTNSKPSSGHSSSGGGSGGGSASLDNYDFWAKVQKSIERADGGDVIKANASKALNVPGSVLRALEGRDVTLVISYKGRELAIYGKNMPSIPDNKVYYTFDDLFDLFADYDATVSEIPAAKPGNPVTGGGYYLPGVTVPTVTLTAELPAVPETPDRISLEPAEKAVEPAVPAEAAPAQASAPAVAHRHLSGVTIALAALIAAVAVGGITTGVWLYKRREQE